MTSVLSEMPLALFTTLSSIGAGAFVTLAVAQLAGSVSADAQKKLGRAMTLPVVLVVLSFIAAFCHLASPLNAPAVFMGVGSSPMSNEIAVACVFTVVAIIYWALSLAGKLAEGAAKAFGVVVAVLAVVYAIFMGMAYMMDTITSWNSAFSPIQMLGFALVGGSAAAACVFEFSGVFAGDEGEKLAGAVKAPAIAVAVVGALVGVVGVFGMVVTTSGAQNAMFVGANLVSDAMAYIIVGIIVLVVACACAVMYFAGKRSAVLAVVGLVAALCGVLVCRLAFYAMAISVGLAIF
jgi:anaerobic dimethyl sulfoxide reductase subunit C (anchor subunit)/Tat-targeted selenate reductase subunit YnfH